MATDPVWPIAAASRIRLKISNDCYCRLFFDHTTGSIDLVPLTVEDASALTTAASPHAEIYDNSQPTFVEKDPSYQSYLAQSKDTDKKIVDSFHPDDVIGTDLSLEYNLHNPNTFHGMKSYATTQINIYSYPKQNRKKQRQPNHKSYLVDSTCCEDFSDVRALIQSIRTLSGLQNNENKKNKTATTPPQRFLVILNPYSGGNGPKSKSGATFVYETMLKPMLEQAGVEHDKLSTTHGGHAKERMEFRTKTTSDDDGASNNNNEENQDLNDCTDSEVRDISEYNAIIALGGDGILFEIFQGIHTRSDEEQILSTLKFGIVPCGTCNGLAKSILYWSDDADYTPMESVFQICKGHTSRLDLASYQLAKTNKTYTSFLSFSWGLIADCDLESECLRWIGSIRTDIWAVYRGILFPKKYRARFSYLPSPSNNNTSSASTTKMIEMPKFNNEPLPKDWVTLEDDIRVFWVCNTSHTAHNYMTCPMSQMNDGVFYIMLVRSSVSRLRLLQLLLKLESGAHIGCEGLEVIGCSAYRLEPISDNSYNDLDGELIEAGAIQASVCNSAQFFAGKAKHNGFRRRTHRSRKGGGKSRRELPPGAVAILKAWLLSPEHFTHPYPTPQDQIVLMEKTGIDKKQLKNWFTNARRRIWKPMLKKQLEAGKLAASGAGGAPGGGGSQGGMAVQLSRQPQQQQPPQQEMYSNFQQARMQSDVQYQQQQVQYQEPPLYNTDQQYGQQQYQQQQQESFQVSNSIGSLQPMVPVGSNASFGNQMIKTDSHAVLMELFARDQDLVRQAASGNKSGSSSSGGGGGGTTTTQSTSSGLQASGQSGNLRWAAGTAPAAAQGSGGMGQRQQSVTFAGEASNMQTNSSFASWPHFSSVSSLNNLGGLQGVKSITNLSAADLSSQGNLNKMGNLAQVKSVENMGRGDSYAFLEVFFDDKSGLANGQRGQKREREEDDAIGLSLDDNEASSPMARPTPSSDNAMPNAGVPTPAPLPLDGEEENADEGDGRQLKRAYDDALAARGLIAVRKSCENLNNLDLPAKMQKTLSMEYMHKHAQGENLGNFFSTENSSFAPNASPHRMGRSCSQNFPTQQHSLDPMNASVEVPSTTACALCTTVNVDTQLRPCGHMFHGRCLKPSLQTASGPPKCPICSTPMQSAILAVPSVSSGETA